VYNISSGWVDVLIFLHYFICSRVSGLMQLYDGPGKGTASDFVKVSGKVVKQEFGDESIAVHGKSKLTDTGKGKTNEEQSQEHALNFV
jgi:hypothetical protein